MSGDSPGVPIMFLSSRDQAMDIVMAINMGRMALNLLTSKCSPPGFQGLLRRSYGWPWWKSARVCRCSSQYQVYGPALSENLKQPGWISKFAGLVWTCWQYRNVMTWWRTFWNSDFHRYFLLGSVNVARLRKVKRTRLSRLYRTKKGIGYGQKHAWLEIIFLAYLRSRSRITVYIFH